jgi:hypothetical protein
MNTMSFCEVEKSGHRLALQNESALQAMLRDIGAASDPNATVFRPNGDHLTVSVRDGLVLIVFHRASLEPPYLSASLGPPQNTRYFEFLIGDTPTPVPADRCIPMETAEQVVLEFVRSDTLSPRVRWIED